MDTADRMGKMYSGNHSQQKMATKMIQKTLKRLTVSALGL